MRYASDAASKRQYTEFLARHERCSFFQSVEWAAVKSNWKNEIVLAEDAQGNITGGMSVLIRRVPLFGNLMYSPRGPVCDPADRDSLRQLTEGAELLAWKYNAMALRMEPDVPCGDSAFRAALEDLGCRFRTGPVSARDVIQPRQVFRLDLRGRSEAQVLAGFPQKTRYNIRLAQRRGVTVREGTREDLPVFHALLTETGRRDGFLVRPLAYFQRMWDAMGPDHMALLLAWYDGRPIAGAIPIFYGNKTWYAFGASADDRREVMPCYLLQWEMIRRAIARGCAVYDLRGVLEVTDANDPRGGLYRFKRQFGAALTDLMGEADMVYRPVTWRLYRLAERLYVRLRDRSARRQRGRAVQPAQEPQPLPLALPAHTEADAGHRPKSA